ncbi:ABC transporter permease subunit [Nonomuraea phyllanthi]|uniref:ABC transporter permease subunit n=1 Tax=Nonomuraea phyllanthi TaxID=2219224 RepID=A0A5C4WR80_9ACTN|nr:ABC transporter permease [Nonomuraea phyllanthi]KAB8196066.1 ABC transporter permease subunit [Nonomuraea phyllanthi]QFY07525.1 ABC transporter permease subunit [Nonomuraea phyllanthi]
MLSRRSLVIARSGLKLVLTDPAPMVTTIAMPLLLGAFLIPNARATLRLRGFANATGAEYVIPGMAVLFAFFGITMIGTLFFREHAWGTWDRLRASSATTADLLVGKLTPLYLCYLVQMAVLFGLGYLLFGFRVTGSIMGLALLVLVLVLVLVAFGAMLVAVFSTMDQALTVGSLLGMVMSGLGGALAPSNTLPEWSQAIAHFMPPYWALEGLRKVSLEHGTLSDVTTNLLVLGVFAVIFAGVATFRFNASDAKVGNT